MPSCFVPQLFDSTSELSITDVEFHHLSHVKRLMVGTQIKLNSGSGLLATGEIIKIAKHSMDVRVVSREFHPRRTNEFALAFALLKNKHDELIIEKVTELGATEFYPMVSEFGVRTAGSGTNTRFEKIAVSAIKQCDNPWLPRIHETASLSQALEQITQDGWQPVLCSELRPDIRMQDLDLSHPPCFLIGPEGGWSPPELALFNTLGIPEITISELILRAETAAIAVSAQFAGLHR